MILFLYGADTFRSRQYLRQSSEQFKRQRDPQGYNAVILDGKNIPIEKIMAEIFAMPFLAEKRMIVIENVLSSSDKEMLNELIRRIEEKRMLESNVIIFWQGEPLSKVKEAKELSAVLEKEKYAQEFAPFIGAKLVGWIQKEVEQRGGKIAPDASAYLARNAGHDTWWLSSLIDQLVAYQKEKEITLPDAQLFLDEKIDDNIFHMIEALAAGNQKLAFKLLLEQRRLGEEEGKIFGLLVWQFRILLEMSDLLERENNLPSDAIAKKLNIHPFVAKKNLAVAKKYSLAQLQNRYEQLLDIDIKTKTGQADQSLLIDLFVSAH